MTVGELKWKPHSVGMDGRHAVVDFPNGYGASVVTGSIFYSRPETPYEIAVLHNGKLDYSTPITNDVCGYCTEEEANEILRQIEALPK